MSEPTIQEILSRSPEQHKDVIDGEVCLSEVGMVHFCTIVEQEFPEKADRARRLRYATSKHANRMRKGGES